MSNNQKFEEFAEQVGVDISKINKKLEEVGNNLSSNNTGGTVRPKRPPTAHWLDRTTTPWTIWFDNGSGLQFPDYAKTETIYGYGYGSAISSENVEGYPLAQMVLRCANGSVSIAKYKSSGGHADYWADSTKIINPVRDETDFDWSNARLTPGNEWYIMRQRNIIRVMYALGIWSAEEVKGLGAKPLIDVTNKYNH